MKTTAFEELTALLSSAGLNEKEISVLLGRFLEEDADLYCECMKSVEEESRRISLS